MLLSKSRRDLLDRLAPLILGALPPEGGGVPADVQGRGDLEGWLTISGCQYDPTRKVNLLRGLWDDSHSVSC